MQLRATSRRGIALLDLEPSTEDLRQAVLRGLARTRKTLPPKLFYDERGARLFERICELDAYYPTRAELAILRAHGDEIARSLGPALRLVELGSGSGLKTRLLLRMLDRPAAYVPVDISKAQLIEYAATVADEHPSLQVLPVCADYTERLELPPVDGAERTVVFFPGSTIGNLEPADAEALLRRLARLCGPDGGLLVGADLKKDAGLIEAAYNDPEGVTAAFNLNVLERINRECGADFEPSAFRHRAVYEEGLGRIQMRLVSRRDQCVHIPDAAGSGATIVRFHEGEFIDTEHSYKYTIDEFAGLAARVGFASDRVWTDPDRLFSVHWLRSAADAINAAARRPIARG